MKCLNKLSVLRMTLSSQSVSKLGDACVNQLLAVTQEIYNCCDEGFGVRGEYSRCFGVRGEYSICYVRYRT